MNATNPDTNAWAPFERGEVDFAEFCELFEAEGRELGHHVDAALVMAGIGSEVRPEMVEAVRFCRRRFKTAALTNNFVGPVGDHRAGIGAILGDLFDVVIESSKVGVRKPDPKFYRLACEALEVEPTEAVFLDDLGVNLKPARAMGMRTIKVVSAAQAIADLYEVLGVAPDGWEPPAS
jgi:putative hydrolase of the HAD superfamily